MNWLSELSVVAVGVLLALWAQGLLDRRHHRALENQYVASLKDDLSTDLKMLQGMVDRLTVFNRSVRTVLDVVDGRTERIENPSAFLTAVTTCFYVEFFHPTTTTLDELTASGHIRLLWRRELVRAVLAYHQRVGASYRTHSFFLDRLWNGLWAELKNCVDPEVFPAAAAKLYEAHRIRLDALHGETQTYADPRVEHAPSTAIHLERLRDNESLRRLLIDALEIHELLRGEFEVYSSLCRETLDRFNTIQNAV